MYGGPSDTVDRGIRSLPIIDRYPCVGTLVKRRYYSLLREFTHSCRARPWLLCLQLYW